MTCKFKVGDTVKIIEDGKPNYSGYRKGETFEVRSINARFNGGWWLHEASYDRGKGVHDALCETVKESPYFPILIKINGRYEVITQANNIPCGVSFTVVQTNIKIN